MPGAEHAHTHTARTRMHADTQRLGIAIARALSGITMTMSDSVWSHFICFPSGWHSAFTLPQAMGRRGDDDVNVNESTTITSMFRMGIILIYGNSVITVRYR